MSKGQGKLSTGKVIQGILAGKKKIDIAPFAGSKAITDSGKINSVNNVVNSSEYKEKTQTLLQKLESERLRILNSMMDKDLSHTAHNDLSLSLERVNKIAELLSGKPTERTESTSEDLKLFLLQA